MTGTMLRMTTQDLLKQYGVTSIKQLCADLSLSRQYGWNIWHGYSGIGTVMMEKLYTVYGIPYAAMMGLEPVTPRKPRGRPHKQVCKEP